MITLVNMIVRCICCIMTNKLQTDLFICWFITFHTLLVIFSYLPYYMSARGKHASN